MAERRRLLERLAREGEGANDVLGELVDLRRLHRGELALDWSNVQLVELFEQLSDWAAPLAEARLQRFELIAEGDLPARVQTDPRRLMRVLRLLVQRAMEPVGGGRVVLIVDRSPDQAAEMLRFTLDREGAARVAHADGATPNDGAPLACDLDLSLSVASSIVEELGGNLETKRAPGGGLQYLLRIRSRPQSRAHMLPRRAWQDNHDLLSQTNQRLASALLAGKRILVADDSEESLRVIEWVLGRAGAACTLVANGGEALERIIFAEQHGTPYQLVLLDLEMPVVDGFQAMQKLRERGYKTPVVALTAHTSEEERQRCRELGFDDFLSKPIDRSSLLRQVAARFYPRQELQASALAMVASAAGECPGPPAPLPAPAKPSACVKSSLAEDESMAELVEWFVQELEKDIERLEKALDAGDRELLATVAHQLKGSAGSYGFSSLSAQADLVENVLTRNEGALRVHQEVRGLIDLCQRVQGS
jgi:CheY-like chemotaxis protein/HPt (histidine-containing phosphotransfer) domain-containing protein